MKMKHLILCGDSLELIKQVPLESVDLIVTSPPYWAKRNYGNGDNEIGLEDTVELYIDRLVSFFQVLKSYLKPTGNLYVNIGDTYFGSHAGVYSKYLDEKGNVNKEYLKNRKEKYFTTKSLQPKIKQDGKLYQNKQLLLIPSRFAIKMQENGWIVRNDIIWHKPNRIPTGVKDRLNTVYEHIYHFVKQGEYYYDLESIKVKGLNGELKNPCDVWEIKTQPLQSEHTASFPEKLVTQIIKSGCSEEGVVLDPFLGTGTTWVVSHKLGRRCIGFEINEKYYKYAQERFRENTRQLSLW